MKLGSARAISFSRRSFARSCSRETAGGTATRSPRSAEVPAGPSPKLLPRARPFRRRQSPRRCSGVPALNRTRSSPETTSTSCPLRASRTRLISILPGDASTVWGTSVTRVRAARAANPRRLPGPGPSWSYFPPLGRSVSSPVRKVFVSFLISPSFQGALPLHYPSTEGHRSTTSRIFSFSPLSRREVWMREPAMTCRILPAIPLPPSPEPDPEFGRPGPR